MGKLLFYFMIIRFRKVFSKGDYLAVSMVILAYIAVAFVIFNHYEKLKYYNLVFFIECLIYHWNRKDIELLKLIKSYKAVLFIEYLIYMLPMLVVLVCKAEWWWISILFLTIYGFISLPKRNGITLKYPFRLIDPFWTISFRKYKLLIVCPLTVGVVFLANAYQNENLIAALVLLLTVLACVPSFEKERVEELKLSTRDARTYLEKQVQINVINTLIFVLPLLILLILFFKWSLLYMLFLPFIAAAINTVLRYLFFNNPLQQQLFFVFYMALTVSAYGIPLLVLPFLYKKAVKNINCIKYVED